ncbi:uncharacterized protein LTR77_006665 [Saxophila tyrrhenica]|uniref:Myosin class II heavy chain n=1 Tax=Saxophila tyrrhenica TaxID=1690608 RepID=A0AAV9P5H9_9PEZI|nr:hypothetical protein LTR77_006665 [Saxophila tyrrhenica]
MRPPPPPSSPPPADDDSVEDAPSPPSQLTDARLAEHLLSPDLARIPPPRTPATRDTSSDYYTAAWGSPYELSPSLRSAHTAPSEQPPSEDLLGSSPGPDFGLGHLIPSRLGDLNSSPSRRAAVPERETVAGAEEDSDVTPRSRTKRWVQLPRREEESEKAQWWSDESRQTSPDHRPRRGRRQSFTNTQSKDYALGHPTRESNRTLDQQTFWKSLREKRPPNMSSLYSSRWAATPPAEDDSAPVQEKPAPGLASSRWADTPPLPDTEEEKYVAGMSASSWADSRSPQDAGEVRQRGSGVDDGGKAIYSETEPTEDADGVQPVGSLSQSASVVGAGLKEPQTDVAASTDEEAVLGAQASRPEDTAAAPTVVRKSTPGVSAEEKTKSDPSAGQAASIVSSPMKPRSKKKVNWKGKMCTILIPNLDYAAFGSHPMSVEEAKARFRNLEDQGYDLRGYDSGSDFDASDAPVHVKPIFPDETEIRVNARSEGAKVQLPDLNRWKAYMDHLREQKLAALGVSLGGDEPTSAGAPDMSRQSSAQYPPLPFSPPIPSGSVNSMGRPGMVRGHSHTMSVASPISPMNGPKGHHMRTQSTFAGPFGFQYQPDLSGLRTFSPSNQQPGQQPTLAGLRSFSPQSQQLGQQNGFPGLQSFSPQDQYAIPGFNRVGSPAQLGALRNAMSGVHGPGSPFSQQLPAPSPQSYSRSNGQPVPGSFFPQMHNSQLTPALPELPEEDSEEELRELEQRQAEESDSQKPAYVPPHKRAQLNADIAVPTPRSHRHNISEGLERDVQDTENRQQASWQQNGASDEPPTVEERMSRAMSVLNAVKSPSDEKDPLSQGIPVQESPNNHKRDGSRAKGPAPTSSTFKFNPGATFEPGSSSFTFGAPAPKPAALPASGHNRNQSSSNFNVAAPEFKPSGTASMPKSDFNFSSGGPVFKPGAPTFEPVKKAPEDNEALPSIFGKVDIPAEIVKPARRSKAVAIVRPDEAARQSGSGTDLEDEDGRIVQSDDRLKRQRKVGGDDDEVPRFAEVTPMPAPSDFIVKSQSAEPETQRTPPVADDKGNETTPAPQPAAYRIADVVDVFTPPDSSKSVEPDFPSAAHGHKHSTSLSALAKPFEPFGSAGAEKLAAHEPRESIASISELEEGEIREDAEPQSSHSEADQEERSISPLPESPIYDQPASARLDTVADTEPSFAEIDAVMRRLNEVDESRDVPELHNVPATSSPAERSIPDAPYLPAWQRSDAPSPSPKRRQLPFNVQDSSFTIHNRTDSAEIPINGWADLRRLNKDDDVPNSDWSGVFSAQDEEKLHDRGQFFDSHIDRLIGSAVDRRLQPLEESLQAILQNVSKRPISRDLVTKRSSSAIESDADDEDESDQQRQRPISRGRDKRIDQIKAAVVEAMREQSPVGHLRAGQDIQELHAVLADMKMSFARAASAGLELDDIRAVVEEALGKQSQALVPANDDGKESGHKREVSELEGRLNETLAGALEEANRRRAVEEREVETKRMLRSAEEELQLLRESAQDNDSRLHAAEREREELLRRVHEAEDAQRDAEERVTDLEAEHEAAQGTLEEYRMSSSRWRQDIDEATRDREDLETTIATLERELEESQEMSGNMRRRLEKLHSDMANAAGQLASEKATRQAKEDEYRIRCEQLEAQQSLHVKDHAGVEEELNVLRASASEAAEAKVALEQMRVSNGTLEDTVRKLQLDLEEQRSLTTRFEREFNDAREAGRSEVERTRLSMETDIETANHQVNVVRAEFEGELAKVRAELESTKMEAEDTKARHARMLEEEESAKREALRKVNHANSVALDETRQKYEAAIHDLKSAHTRAIDNAVEDKQRSEYFLNERLSLSDAKLQHFQDRVLHLEERLQVAKSAAQAAVMSAHSKPMPTTSTSSIPEKISPQALRESILVLQDQLQERESTIEKLRNQVDEQGPAELKKRDDEIAWLRELLTVRSEELTDLVNTLAQPTFDRTAVRDTAIRIRANLQMEQQEKDRIAQNSSLPGQAIASLSNFATPKLGAAFSKWRSTMESSALRNAPKANQRPRSSTPSRPPAASTKMPPEFSAGLMTPPASNLRSTPSPEVTRSMPPPRLHSSAGEQPQETKDTKRPSLSHSREPSGMSDGPTTPLFRSQSYDKDAEDHSVNMQSFEDEDLDVADNRPPAFRSLEAELDSADEEGAMA